MRPRLLPGTYAVIEALTDRVVDFGLADDLAWISAGDPHRPARVF
jgi:hypothetical protein